MTLIFKGEGVTGTYINTMDNFVVSNGCLAMDDRNDGIESFNRLLKFNLKF